MAFEQACHLLGLLDMSLGIGFEAKARVVDRAFLADAGEHVLKGTAMGRVIEHATGGNQGNADARGEIGERGDAGTIVAAISVPRREVEGRLRAERCFDAAKLCFELPPPARGRAGVGVSPNRRLCDKTPTRRWP